MWYNDAVTCHFETAVINDFFFSIYQLHVPNSENKRENKSAPIVLVTRTRKNKSVTIESVTWSEIKYFSTSSQ